MMIRKCFPLLAVLLIPGLAAAFNQADEVMAPVPSSITVLPTAVELRHQRQPQGLQVMGTSADGYSLDLRSQAKFVSADSGDPHLLRLHQYRGIRILTAVELLADLAHLKKTTPHPE